MVPAVFVDESEEKSEQKWRNWKKMNNVRKDIAVDVFETERKASMHVG